MDGDVPADVLGRGVTAVELDAAVRLNALPWSAVVRFAVDRLAGGWDTPALRELAGEPLDDRRLDPDRVDALRVRVLTDVGLPGPENGAVDETAGWAVTVHAAHLLRLRHRRVLTLLETLDALSQLSEMLAGPSPISDALWDLGPAPSRVRYADETALSDPADVVDARTLARARLAALGRRIDDVLAARPPAPDVFTPHGWDHGSVLVTVELGELGADTTAVELTHAVAVLRDEAGIVGSSPEPDVAPGERFSWRDPDWARECGATAYGTALHPDGTRIVCGYGTETRRWVPGPWRLHWALPVPAFRMLEHHVPPDADLTGHPWPAAVAERLRTRLRSLEVRIETRHVPPGAGDLPPRRRGIAHDAASG